MNSSSMKASDWWQRIYIPPNSANWRGRNDASAHEFLYQIVSTYDLRDEALPLATNPQFVFIGFACDEGIHRNHGRIGASLGPDVIRQNIGSMPLHFLQNLSCLDVGNITCNNGQLEISQEALGEMVRRIFEGGATPIVLGGGHELAFGHYLGIAKANKHHKLGIINFDAHFDLRPLLADDKGSSGTPFRQIALHRAIESLPFNYLCLGIQESANSQTLFDAAHKFGVQFCTAKDLREDIFTVTQKIQNFIDNCEAIYLSICVDVFAEALAPGVSAPQALGLWPQEFLPWLKLVIASGKVISFDFAELSPPLDESGQTVRWIRQCLYEVWRGFIT